MRQLSLFILAATLWLSAPAQATNRLPTDLTFTVIDGPALNGQTLRGQPLLIVFWASTCAPCIAEMPSLSALYRELQPRGLQVLALAMPYDPPNRVAAARDALEMPFPVALDVNARVVRRLGIAPQTPQFLLVDAEGHIIDNHSGVLSADALRARLLPLLADA
ncbi:TlpA disulfide reductase family protein [Immundisolibacter sp.]|jgi:thiol-disulfide isomerase/thioredoxin|uniref:TlpA disulfide reductase family protein n=1 Tax=Immundisolibacter sp. TaxID=1934948 RepID=UPI0035633618